jgi:hypothetical protein
MLAGVSAPDALGQEEAITAHHDVAAIYRETGDRHSEDIALKTIEQARAAQAE